ncbi:MBL fold metallo-hydrolase [Pedococcus sp. 2YAF34]|uniref:MBL fold metallo-hydrolase n=1 Tax=Pedococcus sp. 2YAF34 TaxID=3233032 RepID=UPI003F979018
MDIELQLPPNQVDTGEEDSVRFIGNATVLLRYGGFTILTDPTFVHRHEKVDLGHGLHATRLTDPAMEVEELPPLDLVLLSHYHGDHFDQVAQAKLDRSLPVVTTPQARDQLHELGFGQAVGLDTWDAATVRKGDRRLRITSCPGRHGPGISDLALPDVMGSVLQADDAAVSTIYVSGDTLMYDDLGQIPKRYPEVDLGLFHLGGTKVLGIMVTMDAEQGVEAVRLIDPSTAIPIHFDDYDVFTSPLSDFTQAAEREGLGDRVVVLERGQAHPLR